MQNNTQNITKKIAANSAENSVHLQLFPSFSGLKYDDILVSEMSKIRDICSLALSIRKAANIKVRTPLSQINLYGQRLDFVQKYEHLILDEINVKKLNIFNDISKIGEEVLKINFKTLGPKVGKNIQAIIAAQKNNEYKKIDENTIEVAQNVVKSEDFTLAFQAKDGSQAKFSSIAECAVDLNISLTAELIEEGIMRDIIRLIQQDRKASDFNVSHRINVSIFCQNSDIKNAILKYEKYIKSQCLCHKIEILQDEIQMEKNAHSHEINDQIVKIILSSYV